MSTIVRTVMRQELRSLRHNRGVMGAAIGMMVLTELVLRLTGSAPRALITMLNIVLLIVPLVSLLVGVISWHGAREFNELLLAQPVPRRALFHALYLSLIAPIAVAFSVGVLAPLLVHRALTPDVIPLLMAVLIGGVALTFVFGGLALLIGVQIDDRLRGVSVALAVWLALTVAYDGVVLLIATTFSDYPLERPMLLLTVFNPVDLARTMIIMQSDTAALMGYTGAVMNRFLGSILGTAATVMGLAAWILIPAFRGRRAFMRRDF